MAGQKTKRTCPKGHIYYKASDCPTCPLCEQERKPNKGFLSLIPAPARRAFESKNISSLEQLSTFSEADILKLHGLGPNSIPKLKKALEENGLTFNKSYKNEQNKKITVETTIAASVDRVWRFWTEREHIKQWNNASDDWQTTRAENDLTTGGRFTSRMEAKDGSADFDFGGTYSEVKPREYLAYTMDDGRKVTVDFKKEGDEVKIVETFEPEDENSAEMQRNGWQAILDNFKRYVEENL